MRLIVTLLASIMLLLPLGDLRAVEYYAVEATHSGVPDGTYTCRVDYYNPKTRREATYTLKVYVRGNRVRIIYFDKGGHLDEDHFTAPLIEDGKAIVETDQGTYYTVYF